MSRKTCTICAAPIEIQNIVNQKLAEKVRMVDIAYASGFSKSAIHRHSSKCLSRRVLAAYKEKRFQSPGNRYVIRQDGVYRDGNIALADWRNADFVLEVVYDPPPTFEDARNPSAIKTAAHLEALAEDAARFPKKLPDPQT